MYFKVALHKKTINADFSCNTIAPFVCRLLATCYTGTTFILLLSPHSAIMSNEMAFDLWSEYRRENLILLLVLADISAALLPDLQFSFRQERQPPFWLFT